MRVAHREGYISSHDHGVTDEEDMGQSRTPRHKAPKASFWKRYRNLVLALVMLTLLVFIVGLVIDESYSFTSKPTRAAVQTLMKTKRTRKRSAVRKSTPTPGSGTSGPALYTYKVIKEYWHDPDAFTQGLQFDKKCELVKGKKECKDVYYESTGMNGQSTVREVSMATGKPLRKKKLPNRDFGEGLVKLKNKLYQVLWQTGKIYIYAANNFSAVETRKTQLSDGWGLTTDNSSLIISDGSSRLYWVDPTTLQTKRSVEVNDNSKPIKFINELEWVEGEVWANIWQTECIARINPSDGKVKGWLLMHGLRSKLASDNFPQKQGMDVLNGIAYDAKTKRVFVTGKYWAKLYQISIETKSAAPSFQELAEVQRMCHQ